MTDLKFINGERYKNQKTGQSQDSATLFTQHVLVQDIITSKNFLIPLQFVSAKT